MSRNQSKFLCSLAWLHNSRLIVSWVNTITLCGCKQNGTKTWACLVPKCFTTRKIMLKVRIIYPALCEKVDLVFGLWSHQPSSASNLEIIWSFNVGNLFVFQWCMEDIDKEEDMKVIGMRVLPWWVVILNQQAIWILQMIKAGECKMW